MNLRELYNSGKLISFDEAARDLQLAAAIQNNLIRLELLEPPADGQFGPISLAAIRNFQSKLKINEQGIGKQTCEALIETKLLSGKKLRLDSGFASAITRYYQARGWYFTTNPDEINICYIEGANADGQPNQDTPNEWNDRRIVWRVINNIPIITGNWQASCEPGWYYTLNPMNAGGCARIKNPAQYKAWRVGTHGGSQPHVALVQAAEVEIYRDRNKDMKRTGDALYRGLFGINQHWGYEMAQVDRASAGCMTAPSWDGHLKFMQMCRSDRRYHLNNAYLFLTSFIPGNQLWQAQK